MPEPEIPVIPTSEAAEQPTVLEFDAFAVCASPVEAERLMDALMDAAEEILCGREGDDHKCPRDWTAGGNIHPAREGD